MRCGKPSAACDVATGAAQVLVAEVLPSVDLEMQLIEAVLHRPAGLAAEVARPVEVVAGQGDVAEV